MSRTTPSPPVATPEPGDRNPQAQKRPRIVPKSAQAAPAQKDPRQSPGAAAAKAKQVAGSAVDSTVDAGNKFAAGVKQGYNQQAASPSAGGSKSSTSSSELRIAGAPVVPGQPLSQKQIAVMKMSMDSGNSYPPEVMAQYNKQNGASSTKESITQSEDDTILAMIRAVR